MREIQGERKEVVTLWGVETQDAVHFYDVITIGYPVISRLIRRVPRMHLSRIYANVVTLIHPDPYEFRVILCVNIDNRYIRNLSRYS
jgi:hypothetical protein